MKQKKSEHVVSPSNLAAYRAVKKQINNSGLSLLPHDKKVVKEKSKGLIRNSELVRPALKLMVGGIMY